MRNIAYAVLLVTGIFITRIGFSADTANAKPLFDPNAAINYSVSAQLAARVGDVVTIRIVESLVSKKRRTDKTGKDFRIAAPLTSGLSWLSFVRKLGLSGESKSDVTRNKDIDDSLKSTISARVIEVLPNGDLVIEGKRAVSVANDKQAVYIKGTVRPYDLDANNTVDSTKVADLEVKAEDKSKSRGILYQLLKFLF